MTRIRRTSTLAALLLVASTVVFATGVWLERNAEPDEGPGAEGEESEGEALFGLNLESPALVLAAIGSSLALAVALWRWPRRAVLLVAVVVTLAFALLDAREVLYKVREQQVLIGLVAGAAMLLHLAVAISAGLALQARPA